MGAGASVNQTRESKRAMPDTARPTLGIGWRPGKACTEKGVAKWPKRLFATAMPGTAPRTARRMVRRSN